MAYRRCTKCWERHSLSETICLNCGADLSHAEGFKDFADLASEDHLRLVIAERTVGSVTILDLSGPLAEGRGADELGRRVALLLDRGSRKILLNLVEVRGGDDAGIAELVRAYTAVTRQSGMMRVVLSQRIGGPFSFEGTIKLLVLFDCFRDETEALRSFD